MKSRLFFLLLLLALGITDAFSQRQLLRDRWHKGRIMLSTADTLYGQINYNPESNLLRIAVNDVVKTYSPQKVITFDFFDQQEQRVRFFETIPFAAYSSYQTPIFFETLFIGDHATLLGRQTLQLVNRPPDPFMPGPQFMNEMRDVYEFYLQQGDRIRKLRGKKRDLLSLLGSHQEQINAFMRSNNLRADRDRDLVRIIRYYNQIAADES